MKRLPVPIMSALIIFYTVSIQATSLFHFAANTGDLATIEAYLDSDEKFPVNAIDEHGRTALHYAVARGHIEIVASLIQADADVFVQDNSGNTPLHLAARYNNKILHKQLIKVGGARLHQKNTADEYVLIKNRHGNTPLHIAAYYGNNIFIDCIFAGTDIVLFIKALACTNTKELRADQIAAKRGHPHIVTQLKRYYEAMPLANKPPLPPLAITGSALLSPYSRRNQPKTSRAQEAGSYSPSGSPRKKSPREDSPRLPDDPNAVTKTKGCNEEIQTINDIIIQLTCSDYSSYSYSESDYDDEFDCSDSYD